MAGTGGATTLRFLGATGTVTGSRFLVRSGQSSILVDCGMYQGSRDLRRRNWAPFPARPDQLTRVVLSHAHLDHCGWLPRLVREGYDGPVLCSPWTAQVAPIVLRDAAHLQEEDAEHAARKGSSRHAPPLPLFTTADAEKAIGLLVPLPYGQPYPIGEDATVLLHRAGHILGSSTVELRAGGRAVAFSGDLGRRVHPLLSPPEPAPAADALVVESTYGDRTHPPRDLTAVAEPIRRAIERGGVVVIPAFAIDRTEVVLMALRELFATGALPPVPVYVDSPMALAALTVYRRAVESGDPEVRPMSGDPFDTGDLHLVDDMAGSIRLNDPPRPCILISASGMATGGRVLHHLASLAPQPRNLILLSGFQVPGTRGRALLDGATSIKIFGEYVAVRAEVVGVDELSAHADADDLLAWLGTCPQQPRACYIVHGEPDAARALRARIESELGWCAVTPRYAETVLW